jgi:CheY-like chemotaxis protein
MAKIVFCEDEIMIQKLLRVILRSANHEIYIASDGAEGLELIERVRPDLIFTDIAMPICNGYELADAVKAQPHLAHIPIIFVSARAKFRTQRELSPWRCELYCKTLRRSRSARKDRPLLQPEAASSVNIMRHLKGIE